MMKVTPKLPTQLYNAVLILGLVGCAGGADSQSVNGAIADLKGGNAGSGAVHGKSGDVHGKSGDAHGKADGGSNGQADDLHGRKPDGGIDQGMSAGGHGGGKSAAGHGGDADEGTDEAAAGSGAAGDDDQGVDEQR